MKKERPKPSFSIENPEAIEKAQLKLTKLLADIYFKHEEEINKKIRMSLE